MTNNNEIGIINEVGDLGLGFVPLSEEEQAQVREIFKESETSDKESGH